VISHANYSEELCANGGFGAPAIPPRKIVPLPPIHIEDDDETADEVLSKMESQPDVSDLDILLPALRYGLVHLLPHHFDHVAYILGFEEDELTGALKIQNAANLPVLKVIESLRYALVHLAPRHIDRITDILNGN
jgi:hypothetical protein